MIIHDIADYLVNLTCKDIKPDIYSVFDSPYNNNCPNNVNSEKLTILEILNAIGCRLKNLFRFVKINTSTETIDEDEAAVNVSGDVDNLNFDFKIPRGKTGPQGPAGPGVATGGTTGQVLAKKSDANYDTEWVDNAGAPGPENLVIVTATASTTVQGEYIPDTTYTKALADIQANKAVMIKLENVPGRYYIPYSSSNAEILASAGTVSGSKQSIELYLLKWTASNNTITITGTKEGCIADGGTAGQVLVKKSNESFDTEWKLHYKIVIYGQPFNKSDLIKLFNNGTLIYVYNTASYRLYTIYALAENILYGISGITFNATVHSISSNRCQITDDNNITLLYDTIYGIANGGTTGQILAKKSNTNGDTKWIDPPSGSGLTKTVLWTNPNPKNEMAGAQLVMSDFITNYKLITIEYLLSTTLQKVITTVYNKNTDFTETRLYYYDGYRDVKLFGQTLFVTNGWNLKTNVSDNTQIIPLRIVAYD